MTPLGTLGGTIGGPMVPGAEGSMMINNRGQIIGTSSLAGDKATHAFVWDDKSGMTDLKTLGGPNSYPLWINEAGDIVGEADISDVQIGSGQFQHHAFLWRDGNMRGLGTLGGTSHAESINNKGQVVGRSRLGPGLPVLQHAFLWEDGGPMLDLNTLIPAGNFQLIDAYNINDRGEILVQALPLGEQPREGVQLGHLALLVPCESGDSCNESSDARAVAVADSITLMGTANRSGIIQRNAAEWRTQLAGRYHLPGAGIQQH